MGSTRIAPPPSISKSATKSKSTVLKETTIASTNLSSSIMKNVLKTSHIKQPTQGESPKRLNTNYDNSPLITPSQIKNQALYQSFIFQHRSLFSSYLGIITQLIVNSPKIDLFNLWNDIYVSNDSWNEVVKIYTSTIFQEINMICDKTSDSNDITLDKTSIYNFLDGKKVVEYYNAILTMCNHIIFKEKLNTGSKDSSKKKWKNVIRKILQNMTYLVKPNIGLLAEYIQTNNNLNSLLISSKTEASSNYNLIRYQLYKSICEFLRKLFSFNSRFSCFLTEDIAAFYIRFAYINFVKLYSHSNNSELNEINKKIHEISKLKSKGGPDMLISDNIPKSNKNPEDENGFTQKGQPRKPENKSYQIILSALYLKLLLAISRNRTDDIKRKFYQYRILEFFSREIDLEFDVIILYILVNQ